jgi:hypothetical protein
MLSRKIPIIIKARLAFIIMLIRALHDRVATVLLLCRIPALRFDTYGLWLVIPRNITPKHTFALGIAAWIVCVFYQPAASKECSAVDPSQAASQALIRKAGLAFRNPPLHCGELYVLQMTALGRPACITTGDNRWSDDPCKSTAKTKRGQLGEKQRHIRSTLISWLLS